MGALATRAPVFRAAAGPRLVSCRSTTARWARATPAVASADPSLTTITSRAGRIVWAASARRHRSTPAAPSREQTTTLSLGDIGGLRSVAAGHGWGLR